MAAYLDSEVLVAVDLLFLAKYLQSGDLWRGGKEKGGQLTG